MKKLGNKRLLATLSALTCATALLAGCDTFTALPDNYNDKIVSNENIYGNRMSVLYDAIAKGQTDKVLDEFMLILAKDQFGDFYEELKVAVEGTDEAKDAFIESHKNVFEHENDKELLTSYGKDAEDVNALKALRRSRLVSFYNRVNKRVVKTLYNDIISGSYSDRAIFDEKRFAMSKYASFYEVDIERTDFFKGYLPVEFTDENIESVLKVENYKDYIERGILPNIYRELLVEEYLFNESYNTIARAYGRKVNIVKLTSPAEHSKAATNLMTAFTDRYIFDKTNDNPTSRNEEIRYDVLFNAWKGFEGIEGSDEASFKVKPLSVDSLGRNRSLEIQNDAGFATINSLGLSDSILTNISNVTKLNKDEVKQVALESELGLILEKYSKIFEIYDSASQPRFASEEAINAENEFTNSHTYSKETGLVLKIADVAKKDYITDGWHIKNGGLSDLTDSEPEKVRTRLFNISVANAVDYPVEAPYSVETSVPVNDNSKYDPKNYVRNINNHYFLTPAVSQQASINPRNFLMQIGGSDYLVEVVEATSTSKLAKNGTSRYCDIWKDDEGVQQTSSDSELFTEEVAMEIAHILASKESYINDARAHYIKNSSVEYHDNTVYDFFKDKFPELFEEEK